MHMLSEELDRERISWRDDVLTADECREIVDELDYALWRRSTVLSAARNGRVRTHLSGGRTSESTTQFWFTDELQARLSAIEAAICCALGVEVARLEQWQALRYSYRTGFQRHHDAGLFASEPAGERTTTLLLYLHAPGAGGSTWFPNLHLSVAPRPGRLLAWRNLTPDGRPDPAMEHVARPVRKGRKVALTTWVRERPARTV